MTDHPDNGAPDVAVPEGTDWLIEPVTSRGWKVYVELGPESGLPASVTEAVDHLMRTLEQNDVTIYTDDGIIETAAGCTKCTKCTKCDKNVNDVCWTKWFVADQGTFGISE